MFINVFSKSNGCNYNDIKKGDLTGLKLIPHAHGVTQKLHMAVSSNVMGSFQNHSQADKHSKVSELSTLCSRFPVAGRDF